MPIGTCKASARHIRELLALHAGKSPVYDFALLIPAWIDRKGKNLKEVEPILIVLTFSISVLNILIACLAAFMLAGSWLFVVFTQIFIWIRFGHWPEIDLYLLMAFVTDCFDKFEDKTDIFDRMQSCRIDHVLVSDLGEINDTVNYIFDINLAILGFIIMVLFICLWIAVFKSVRPKNVE